MHSTWGLRRRPFAWVRGQRLRMRRRKIFLWLTAAVLGLGVGFVSLLPWLLVHRDGPTGRPTHIALMGRPSGSEQRLRAAAAALHRGERREILLFRAAPTYATAYHVLPPREVTMKERLVHLGVPADHIAITQESCQGTWGAAACLATWLGERPEANVDLLVPVLYSGYVGRVLNKSLPAPMRRRVCVVPLGGELDGQVPWWQSRRQQKIVADAAFHLLFAMVTRESPNPRPLWNPFDLVGAVP